MQQNKSRYTINELYRDGKTQKYQKGTRFENSSLIVILLAGRHLRFNSCVHYFSIKSCVHICHARDKNIETITVGFTGLEKLHEYILSGLNSQLNDHMTSFPVNFRFNRMFKILLSKIFIAPKDSP